MYTNPYIYIYIYIYIHLSIIFTKYPTWETHPPTRPFHVLPSAGRSWPSCWPRARTRAPRSSRASRRWWSSCDSWGAVKRWWRWDGNIIPGGPCWDLKNPMLKVNNIWKIPGWDWEKVNKPSCKWTNDHTNSTNNNKSTNNNDHTWWFIPRIVQVG